MGGGVRSLAFRKEFRSFCAQMLSLPGIFILQGAHDLAHREHPREGQRAVLGPQPRWQSQDSNPDLQSPVQLPFSCPRSWWWGISCKAHVTDLTLVLLAGRLSLYGLLPRGGDKFEVLRVQACMWEPGGLGEGSTELFVRILVAQGSFLLTPLACWVLPSPFLGLICGVGCWPGEKFLFKLALKRASK